MRNIAFAAACAAATMICGQANAAPAGTVEIKLMATGVLPDGKIESKNTDLIGLPAGTDTKANDNVVPTLAIEYYASPSVSIETICCFTQHHVTATAGLPPGADIARHLLILPATLTLKYHLDAGAIRPYVGAGPAMFIYFGEKPGADAQALGAASLKMDNKVGFALQGGFDLPVGERIGVSLDAKRYFMKATTHFYNAAGAEALSTTHKLDPWVISGGVYFEF